MDLSCCRRLQTASSLLETFKDELHRQSKTSFFAESLSKLRRCCVLPQILHAIASIHCTTTRAHTYTCVGILIIDAARACGFVGSNFYGFSHSSATPTGIVVRQTLHLNLRGSGNETRHWHSNSVTQTEALKNLLHLGAMFFMP